MINWSLARLLKLFLVLQLAAGGTITALLLPTEASLLWVLLGAVAVPVLGTAVVLGVEILIAALCDRNQPRRSVIKTVISWLKETWASVRLFCWEQPFQANFPEPPLVHDPRRPALLLIHGYMCNRAVWKPLIQSGVLTPSNVATLNLVPVFGEINQYAEPINQAVQNLRMAVGAAKVVLVCHSMGGLAARAYLQRYGDEHIAKVITLATPHSGSLLGRLGHSQNARQMARGSKFLTELEKSESAQLHKRFICIATRDDNLIIPRRNALLKQATNHVVSGLGHLALVQDKEIWGLIKNYLIDPDKKN